MPHSLSLPRVACLLAVIAFFVGRVASQEPPQPKLNFNFAIPGGKADDTEESKNVTFTGAFKLQEGSRRGVLNLTAKMKEGWHVYSITQKPGAGRPSTIKVIESTKFKVLDKFQADKAPHILQEPGFTALSEQHEGVVTWTAPIELAEGVDPKTLTIDMTYDGQVCSNVCIPIFKEKVAAAFAGYTAATPAEKGASGAAATAPANAPIAAAPAPVQPINFAALAPIVGFALLGGLILNLMPCVLPVIGLKVLSFVQQGGQSRAKIFALNLWFVLGLMFVFVLLATAAAFANLSWGQQFTYTWFKVAMVVVVFAFALSFLGVWEVPIPGFAQSSSSSKLQQQEGPTGAFFKGIFTTLLATPCSGPFLGPVFGYTLAQPPLVTYIIFASVGLGMASPYLVIGAFPSLVRWLPKPGEWMETFKQVMGFVLLGTVVYLFATIKSDYFIPTLALVIGVWFACWLIGRVPIYEPASKQLWAWLSGVCAAALIGYLAFTFLGPVKHLYEWRNFQPDTIAKLQTEGKTVMVDFTADWCATCQANFHFAINTPRVKDAVEKNGVVPMLADWSDYNDTIKQKLVELNSNSIPLLVIYPANKPGDVIILRDALLESQVLTALDQAGPSTTAQAAAETAMAPQTSL